MFVQGIEDYNKMMNALNSEKTVHTCLHCENDTPLYCEKCQQELITKNAELQSDNYEIKNTYRRTAQHLNNIGKTELADYMLAQINDVPVWCVGDDKNFIPKQVIRDKFKRINETKIKINKTNARDYMIFSNTERATGWFINIDYIEKILLDVPGHKIGDE